MALARPVGEKPAALVELAVVGASDVPSTHRLVCDAVRIGQMMSEESEEGSEVNSLPRVVQ